MSGDGMSGFISALTSSSGGLTSANMWTEATQAAPLIAAIVIFAFGYYIVRRITKGASHGKVKF